jgi:hypothetical protein
MVVEVLIVLLLERFVSKRLTYQGLFWKSQYTQRHLTCFPCVAHLFRRTP